MCHKAVKFRNLAISSPPPLKPAVLFPLLKELIQVNALFFSVYFKGCNDLGINFSSVCGFDGVTYQSSCHAQQEMAPIDFYSPCQSAVSKSDGMF